MTNKAHFWRGIAAFAFILAFVPWVMAQFPSQRDFAGTAGGSANAITLTLANYNEEFGTTIKFLASNTNTGPTTISVNGLPARNVSRSIPTGIDVLGGGEIVNGNLILVGRNGGSYQLLSNYRPEPPGTVIDYAGAAGCPAGFFETNGGTVGAGSFPTLNTVLGVTWGVSGGNVVLPDLRGRTTFNRDSGGSNRLTTDQSGALAGTLVGTMGGLQNQTLVQNQLPNVAPAFTGTTNQNIAFTAGVGIAKTAGTIGNAVVATASNVNVPFSTSAWSGAGSGDLTLTPSGTVASINGNVAVQAHPVTPPLGVVIKCIRA